MGEQIKELGHTVAWDRENDQIVGADSGINIIVEGFTRGPNGSIGRIAKLHGMGARFICLATEEPSDKGFNQGTQSEMVMRQDTFVDAMPYFEGILHLVPGEGVTRWFQQWAPAAQAELGHAQSLVRAAHSLAPEPEPPFDFGFFGSMSKRRLAILQRLKRRSGSANAVRIEMTFADRAKRDAAMKQAKVIVQLRKFDAMGLVSSSRCNTSLCVGRPVVAEPHLLSKPWDEIVRFAPSLDAFYEEALVARMNWRAIHEAQYCKFRDKLTPEFCVGAPLRRIGVLPQLAPVVVSSKPRVLPKWERQFRRAAYG